MKKYVLSFHYTTNGNGILHATYEVEATNTMEAQSLAFSLSKQFIANHNSENPEDGIRVVSKIQFEK